jgi:sRNA-binding protein
MATKYVTERKRGSKDAAEHIPALRERWPAAFPSAPDLVRPLAIGNPGIIAQAMGWTVPYALGVLAVWKGSPTYCEAVLSHGRINLDGSPNGDEPDAKAKEMAQKQLAKITARNAARVRPQVTQPATGFAGRRGDAGNRRAIACPRKGLTHQAPRIAGR